MTPSPPPHPSIAPISALPPHREEETPGQQHLLGRLSVLEQRVRRAVEARLAQSPARSMDPVQALLIPDSLSRLYHSDMSPLPEDEFEEGDLLEAEAAADSAQERGEVLPLRRLAEIFGLTDWDMEVLLIAIAPDLDSRFQQLYSYLQHDVQRLQATTGLVLYLSGCPSTSGAARTRLISGPMVANGLISVSGMDGEEPFLTRPVHVADQVVSFLLGQHGVDTATGCAVSMPEAAFALPERAVEAARRLGTILTEHPLAYLRGTDPSDAAAFADRALHNAGWPPLAVDLRQLPAGADGDRIARSAVLEARLRRRGLRVGPLVSAPAGEAQLRMWPSLANSLVPTVFFGAASWDAAWSDLPPVHVACPSWGLDDRARAWRSALYGHVADGEHEGVISAMSAYRLGSHDIQDTVRVASAQTGGRVDVPALRDAARSRHAGELDRLARRIEPAVGWEDLVVSGAVREQLRDLVRRARFREQVLGGWRMRPGGGRGSGVAAMFTGDSGTGKTLAAEVVAGAVGLDLYVVNLATVVDKYIGETERNLERIFQEAEGVNGIILFDEADALFGKRSDVTDARDRYANIETAYLLQKLESFDGITILTTNLQSNIDTAFARRLDLTIYFPTPDQTQRRRLWDTCLGSAVPRDASLDLDWLARKFDMPGGSIRCCAITAAYQSAENGEPITLDMLASAVRAEYQKLGRIIDTNTFLPWLSTKKSSHEDVRFDERSSS
ncbi:ATP-binding protein [Streptomyces vinaceus]|uniref:ATP-binding protein n=1 Tax=Streptomyces vinaceus TaxID=1960 RepID=UPI0036A8375C